MSFDLNVSSLTQWILAAGGLGTAAFGIVEGLKWTRLGEQGFSRGIKLLGPLTVTLEVAYGPSWPALLRSQFRQGRTTGELPRTLRQGIRAGLKPENAERLAGFLGLEHAEVLREAATKMEAGEEPTPAERNITGRFELAADTRVDAALGLADSHYVGMQRLWAGFAAVVLAILAAAAIDGWHALPWFRALLVGIAAVPLAPIAKDVVSALQAAQKALKAK
jgi:hypothetical protein